MVYWHNRLNPQGGKKEKERDGVWISARHKGSSFYSAPRVLLLSLVYLGRSHSFSFPFTHYIISSLIVHIGTHTTYRSLFCISFSTKRNWKEGYRITNIDHHSSYSHTHSCYSTAIMQRSTSYQIPKTPALSPDHVLPQQQWTKSWIESVLQQPLPITNLFLCLRSGILLCR